MSRDVHTAPANTMPLSVVRKRQRPCRLLLSAPTHTLVDSIIELPSLHGVSVGYPYRRYRGLFDGTQTALGSPSDAVACTLRGWLRSESASTTSKIVTPGATQNLLTLLKLTSLMLSGGWFQTTCSGVLQYGVPVAHQTASGSGQKGSRSLRTSRKGLWQRAVESGRRQQLPSRSTNLGAGLGAV